MQTVAVGIFCKTPAAGLSKTRLSPPLRPEDCAVLSGCFIRDLAETMAALARGGGITPYAIYTPAGSERELRRLLPAGFRLLLQVSADFGARILQATGDLLAEGHAGAIVVNADSPTLPAAILRDAVAAVREKDCVVLSPAIDGGYTLIGVSRPHAGLFRDIPWSTPQVYRLTLERAAEIGVPAVAVPGWYDVDDRESLALLEAELAGERLPFAAAGLLGAAAPATREFLATRNTPARAGAAW